LNDLLDGRNWMIAAEESTALEPREADDRPEGAPHRLDKSGARVRRMFASIARRYDFLNHLLSLNIDRSWRRFTTQMTAPVAGVPILDCCTGTADLALAYDRAACGKSPIVGTDFCREMLVLGRDKIRRADASGRISLVESDVQRLPLPSDTFGLVSVAFGLRNVGDTARGIDEFIRVTRPGGKVAILEFSRPRGAFLGRIYLTFFRNLLPRIGQAIAPNADNAYSYLPQSVLAFPDGQVMLDLLAERGLTELTQHPLTFGIATLYIGTKPAVPPSSQTKRLDR
jgi:demethylmenaquinone methyltransferase/2-methoxy-6-polyprenyl-1,4-benzoquinol methylase